MISLVLAYCMVEEERFMPSYNDKQKLQIEHDFTADDDELKKLCDPIYLSPDKDDLYVHNIKDVGGLNFTDPSNEASWNETVILNKGWSHYADNRDKDKYGYIADGVDGGQHIAMTIKGGKIGIIEVSYVVSYENFGDAVVWISPPNHKTRHHLCRNKHNFGTRQRLDVDRLSGHWKERASIPAVTIIKQRTQEGAQKTLHLCLLPHNDSRKWKENKFKLLGVRVN